MGAGGRSEKNEQFWNNLERMDIRYWYARHAEKCPNCGKKLGYLPAEVNLTPHFDGRCREQGFGEQEQGLSERGGF